jgi:predicted RNase H-like HicB family nuclease
MTLSVPVEIIAAVHEIEGGGYWAEAEGLPGCVAQAETLEGLRENLLQAVADWLSESREKTAREARQLAAIQGADAADESFPAPYAYQPPPSWTDEDE